MAVFIGLGQSSGITTNWCLCCARVQLNASRVWVGVCGVYASPDPQFLVRGDPTVRKLKAIVTIEALALWFCSNAQRFLHDQLHALTRSL